MKEVQVIGYPFVSHVNQDARPTLGIDFLKRAYVRFSTNNDNLIRYGYYRLMGYQYNFRPHLKKFLYKQYGDWQEAYAPNKTALRKAVYGRIDKIVELNED